MFSRSINNLTLSGPMADEIFQNITADGFNNDSSFKATLRAILAPRIRDNHLYLKSTSHTYRRDTINNNDLRTIIDAGMHGPQANTLHIHNVRSANESDRDLFFDKLDDVEHGFVKSFDGFVELTGPREFMAKNIRERFYINKETKTSVVFVDMMDLKAWHFLQVCIRLILPWYFEEIPLTKEETDLLKSLSLKTPTEYERLIEQAASRFDFRSAMIDKVVARFEKNARKQQLNVVDERIGRIKDEIKDLLDRYNDLIENLDEMNIRRVGLNEILESGSIDAELVEFFRAHKMLDPIGSRGSHLEFVVRTYLDGYDPDMYATIAKRSGSHIWRGYNTSTRFEDISNRKKLLDAIFSDEPSLRVKICAFYDIDIRGSVNTCRGYTFPNNCNDYIPNPHLNYHDCLGDHLRYINDLLLKGDTMGAIEQCISSAKSVNVGEDVTIKYLLEEIFTTKKKVIELSDGRSVTPEEALDWLNEKEA